MLKKAQIEGALQFLAEQQASDLEPFSGAFACTRYESDKNTQVDWTVFNTALTLVRLKTLSNQALFNFTVFEEYALEHCIHSANQFLMNAKQINPEGSFSFWPPGSARQAPPDLDDTALALMAVKGFSFDKKESLLKKTQGQAWEIFAPYRYTRGMKLAIQSRWAEAYPGIFTVWMSSNQSSQEPAIVDAVVVAHICRYLLELQLINFPGLEASLKLLNDLMSLCLKALNNQTLQKLPLFQWMPYYRSLPRFLAACAALPTTTQQTLILREQVEAFLTSNFPDCLMTNFSNALWLADAFRASHLPVPEIVLDRIHLTQQADGGWPEIEICTDLQGFWRWSSRTLSTAMALEILSESQTEKFSQLNKQKELVSSC
jgi:hypothetical protein